MSAVESPGIRETALIVPVPEAEPVVAVWRQRHDPSAAAGVPAHITLLYPFRLPQVIDGALEAELRDLFAGVAPIPLTLAGICAFPNVIYLAPEPAQPFRDLIATLAARYPDTPPYGGAHPDVVPHLTVAHSDNAVELFSVLEGFVAARADRLPVTCLLREAHLSEQDEHGRWQTRLRLPFGASR